MKNGTILSNNIFDEIEKKSLSRRHFLKVAGIFTISVSGAGLISCGKDSKGKSGTNNTLISKGYILVDSKKCQGCLTCMITCSLVNEGCANLSLARLQVTQDPFLPWPEDIKIGQCRQCQTPKCVEACPVEALFIDTAHGSIRYIDKQKCIGCGQCIVACEYEPKKPILTSDEDFSGQNKSRKCDLCLNAPHHWDPAGGGVQGKQACLEICPLGAISFTSVMPVQTGNSGYDVNLRKENWDILGFPSGD